MRQLLHRSYCLSCYEVEGVVVRIGKRNGDMDQLLQMFRVREAAFVTAYNPYSRLMQAGWNHRMQRRLAESTRRWPAKKARSSYRNWSELHLVLFGPSRKAAKLARYFRQNGIVIARSRQPAQLLITCY